MIHYADTKAPYRRLDGREWYAAVVAHDSAGAEIQRDPPGSWPGGIGHGFIVRHVLRPGLVVTQFDLSSLHPLSLHWPATAPTRSAVELSFMLIGGCQHRFPSVINGAVPLFAGDLNLTYGTGHTGSIEEVPAGTQQGVSLLIDVALLRVLTEELSSALPLAYDPVRESPLILHRPMTAQQMTIVQSILGDTLSPGLRRLYLEAKGLELIALTLHGLTQSTSSRSDQPISLRRADRERILQAAAMLTRDLSNPPTLDALATHVGLSVYKLKAGFRAIYQTTVYGYLHREQMQRARALLLTTDQSVGEVALAVGYLNPSKFAAAFRRTFDVAPKAARIEQKFDAVE